MKYLDSLALRVEQRVMTEADENWHDFMNGDAVDIDRDAIIWRALEQDFPDTHIAITPTENIVEKLLEHPVVVTAFFAMHDIILENANQANEFMNYRNNGVYGEMAMRGLSVHDFI